MIAPSPSKVLVSWTKGRESLTNFGLEHKRYVTPLLTLRRYNERAAFQQTQCSRFYHHGENALLFSLL